MRNLKRVLALALAVVMMIGMMVTASAATYADSADIDSKYATAVEVTSGMGLFRGQGTGFAPKATLTRAEAAAILYRVMTTDVTDSKVSLYDYESNKLQDIEAGKWYTGYINFANNGGYVMGDGTNFYPLLTVTGTQFLAMMLRALGYGQMGEYEGAGWIDNVLTDATDLGLIDGIANVASLNSPATREVVAQILWNTLDTTTASYTPALGYVTYWNDTLGVTQFNLASESVTDKWGRPGTVYFYDKNLDGEWDDSTTSKETVYATIMKTPVKTYTTAVTECQVAADLGVKSTITVDTYTNGVDNTATDTINPLAYSKLNAQGRLMEVYKMANGTYDVVYIDTFLAEVVSVAAATYDMNGHMILPYRMTLNVFTTNSVVDGDTITTGYETIVVKSATTPWAYTKGDMLLINAVCENTTTDEDNVKEVSGYAYHVEIVGAATTLVAAQTAYTSIASHHVGGTEYPDAVQFHWNEAQNDATTNYTWYFDQYGNLIAAAQIKTATSYGVITAIKWVDNLTDLASGYALAQITYMDGTQAVEKVYSIDGVALSGVEGVGARYSAKTVSSTMQYNESYKKANGETETTSDYTNVALYSIVSGKYGLQLTTKTALTNAAVKTGLTRLTETLTAGDDTVFLVYNAITKTYASYTGIQNVPSYEGAVSGWYADDKAPTGMVEYVFIPAATAATEISYNTYYYTTGLTYNWTLDSVNGGVKEYYVTGGMLNGETGKTLTFKASDWTMEEIKDALTKDVLLYVEIQSGYVTGVAPVIDVIESIGTNAQTNSLVVYLGELKASGNYLSGNTLYVNGTSFYIANAQTTVFSNDQGYGLAELLKNTATVSGTTQTAYIYVVYDYDLMAEYNGYAKDAQYIYISNVAGLTVEDIENAEEAAELAAAKAEVIEDLEYFAEFIADANSIEVADIEDALNDLIAEVNAVEAVEDLDGIIDLNTTPYSGTGATALREAATAVLAAAEEAEDAAALAEKKADAETAVKEITTVEATDGKWTTVAAAVAAAVAEVTDVASGAEVALPTGASWSVLEEGAAASFTFVVTYGLTDVDEYTNTVEVTIQVNVVAAAE